MNYTTSDLNLVYREYQNLKLGGRNGVSSNFIPGIGPVPSKLMVVGEAPGKIEDQEGKPFQGPSGDRLNRLLELIHVSREKAFVTNVFKYRPPGNRNPIGFEIRKSLPALGNEIRIVDPKVIILCGRIALNSIYPNETVTSVEGRLLRKGKRYIIGTLHPASILYSARKDSRFRRVDIEERLRNDFFIAKEVLMRRG